MNRLTTNTIIYFVLILVAITCLFPVAWMLSSSLKNISNNVSNGENTELFASIVIEIDTPFKLKDLVRSNAFAYLRSLSLLEEEESDEEIFDF